MNPEPYDFCARVARARAAGFRGPVLYVDARIASFRVFDPNFDPEVRYPGDASIAPRSSRRAASRPASDQLVIYDLALPRARRHLYAEATQRGPADWTRRARPSVAHPEHTGGRRDQEEAQRDPDEAERRWRRRARARSGVSSLISRDSTRRPSVAARTAPPIVNSEPDDVEEERRDDDVHD